MVTRGRVRPDTFVDSVALMQVTERVRVLPGVRAAALVMATDLNRRLLDETDLLPAEAKRAGSADLVIAVRAESGAAADAALGQAEGFLAARRGDQGLDRTEPPRSIVGAARRLGGANVARCRFPAPMRRPRPTRRCLLGSTCSSSATASRWPTRSRSSGGPWPAGSS